MTNLSEKFKKIHIKKIALIGHMGSGKSSVGRKLAKKINWDFYDTDAEIERELEKREVGPPGRRRRGAQGPPLAFSCSFFISSPR